MCGYNDPVTFLRLLAAAAATAVVLGGVTQLRSSTGAEALAAEGSSKNTSARAFDGQAGSPRSTVLRAQRSLGAVARSRP